MKKPARLSRWWRCFTTGLAVVLPIAVTFAVAKWLFGTVAAFTDTLLFFLPRRITHQNGGQGPMLWYWSVVAIALAIALITLVGILTRHYIGRKVVKFVDETMLRIPLLNKLYSAVKQVNNAIASDKGTAFKTVVLVEFPAPGMWAVGLITSQEEVICEDNGSDGFVTVFIPTTPNPTTGFLLLVPASKIRKLNVPVSDAIKWVMSLGVAGEWIRGESEKSIVRLISSHHDRV